VLASCIPTSECFCFAWTHKDNKFLRVQLILVYLYIWIIRIQKLRGQVDSTHAALYFGRPGLHYQARSTDILTEVFRASVYDRFLARPLGFIY
jgi:hypothetical protein